MTTQATPPSGPPPLSPAAQRPPRAPRRPPPRRRSFVWSLVTYVGIALLFFVVAVATFLLVAPPIDITRERVITEFKARTGYVLELNGATTLRFLPTPSVEFRDVVVATSEQGGAPVLRVESVEIEALFSALLRGKIQAERVMLKRPQLDLIIDKEGRRKWLRADADGDVASPVRLAQLGGGGAAGRFSTPALRDGGDAAAEPDLPLPSRGAALPAIRIADGIVRYRDLRTGSLVQADQLQLRLSQRPGRKGAPVAGRGSVAFAGETVKVELEAEFAEGRRSRPLERLALRLEGRHGHARYDGAVSLAGQPTAAGMLEVATPQARDAMRWLGFKARDGGLPGPVSFKGRVDAKEGQVRVDELQIAVEGARAAGRIDVTLAGARPRFAADLDFAELDFDKMRKQLDQRPSRRADQSKGRTRDVRRVEAAPAAPMPPATTEEAQDDDSEPAARSGGHRGPHEWRTDPIPFVNLSAADGEARLKAQRLVWRGATLTDAVGALSLSDGAMKIDIRDGTMHGGSAKGVITASAAGHIGIDLALDNASTLEVLSNSGRFDTLDGRARIKVAVAGHGATEKEIVDTLAGSASLDIANGAILGWSVDEIIASARRLEVPNLERNPSARTPFSRMTAALEIKDGIATSKEMRIAASPVSLDSVGTIDLKARTLDLTLNPRLGGEVSAGGNPSRLAALTVPLRLVGPWHRPRLSADYQRILKSPQKAIEAAREAARDIKEEDIDKAAKRFLGDTPQAEKGAKRAKELLKRLLE